MIRGRYSNYLSIDKDFVPVFTEEVDRINKNLWKSFIPHVKFEEVLEKTIKALERANINDTRSIWIYGAYGTGKTHAVFVIKHLLEDDIGEVEDYIEKRNLAPNLGKKLLALREREKILLVFKSGAGHVRTPERLLLEVQDAIYKSYRNYIREYGEYKQNKTEIQLLRERVDDDIINWEMLIEKYRADLKEISSVEDIKRKLDDEDIDLNFVERLLNALEKEGITIFKFSIERFKEWLREIFNDGKITRILFIWDEFSGFFQPGAPLDVFQELAHLTQELPFYLLIVTHRHLEQWSKALTEDVQKLKDRFHYIPYTMETVTTYELISNVICPIKEKSEDWDWYLKHIWTTLESNFSLEKEAYNLVEIERNVNLSDFQKLLPIHPYTAYLSARIAQYFGSSQRTIFKFLKSEEKASFATFLNEHPKDSWYLLTPDFLWDYFFVFNEEVAEFYPEVLSVTSYWNAWKDRLEEGELKVFKVVMLLSALNKRIQDLGQYARPFRSTLKLAFAGTPLYPQLDQILKQLVNKQILRECKTPTDKEYWIPTHEINSEDLDRIPPLKFSEFIEQISDMFDDVVAHRRVALKVISAEEALKGNIPRVNVLPYQTGVILIVMKTLERIEDLKKKTIELSQRHPNTLFLVSLEELGEPEWDTIVINTKYEKVLKKANKEKDAKYYRDEIEEIIKRWLNNIKKGRFYAVFMKSGQEHKIYERVEGTQGIQDVISDVIEQLFPFGLDKIIPKDPLWKKEYSKEGLQIGLEQFRFKANRGKYSELYNIFVIRDRVLDEEGNFTDECELKKNHPLCKMRSTIKEIFEENDSISLEYIWDTLQKPPFGLYNSPIGSFILGILMKEYSEGYYYTDGKIYGEVSPAQMVNLLYDTIKGMREWKLLKLSPEQKKFCELIAEIFGLSEEEVKYPKHAIINLRSKIKVHYRYPLWVLKYALEKEKLFDFDDYTNGAIELFELLDEIVKALPEEDTGELISKNTEKFIKEFVGCMESLPSFDYDQILSKLQRFADPDKFRIGFSEFTNEYFFREISDESKEIPIEVLDNKLRERLQEEPWAWKEEKAKSVLNRMSTEVEVSKLLSEIFGFRELFIDAACNAIKNKIKSGEHLPLWLYRYHPEIDEDTEKVIGMLEKLLDTEPQLIEFDLGAFLEEIKVSKELLNRITHDSRTAMRSWITDTLDKEIGDEELDALIEKIKETVSRNPKIGESQLLDIVRKTLKELRITILRENLRNQLKKIFGTENMIQFYRDAFIPIALVKYLPEFTSFNLPDNTTTDELLKDLTKINNLPEEKLEKYVKFLEEQKEILESIRNPEISYKAFKNFFGKEWIEGIFTENDLEDLKQYLLQFLGQNIEFWTEQQIRKRFENWKVSKYKERFYERLRERIKAMSEKDAKELLIKMIEDSDLGLRIMDLIKNSEVG
ncbi:hypothetical protein AFULGI_00005970 [Archaeoglobus fulgidus DSM 8774]|uniref:Uncharacterized protein n=1 Tax=Archaeoglobus fulgidus DSM 8774 TaxID=1344584 RepID=A0A075WII5_ARCFL|nr:hypothetical protein [Archaeoglobus fulgidus]AIG97398.1 hypothetical protein AFULGI_00005970 [Archaeoglobus fulgidus DSM 8774]